jgi:hypothetical protein
VLRTLRRRPRVLRVNVMFFSSWRRGPELFSSLLSGSHEVSDTFLSRYLPILWKQSPRRTHAPRASSPRELVQKLERMVEETRSIMREAKNDPDFFLCF